MKEIPKCYAKIRQHDIIVSYHEIAHNDGKIIKVFDPKIWDQLQPNIKLKHTLRNSGNILKQDQGLVVNVMFVKWCYIYFIGLSTILLRRFYCCRSQMFFKIGFLKNLGNFTGKHLCWSLFFNKVVRSCLIFSQFLQKYRSITF